MAFFHRSAVILQTRYRVATDESQAKMNLVEPEPGARSRVEQTPASTSQHPGRKEPGDAAQSDSFKNGMFSVTQKIFKVVRQNCVADLAQHQSVLGIKKSHGTIFDYALIDFIPEKKIFKFRN